MPMGHAHNDYFHVTPLVDAMAHGFASFEADVHPEDGVLVVKHDKNQIIRRMTLRDQYLEPMRQLVTANGGSLFGDGEEVQLLVDIKSSYVEAYWLLDSLLQEYADIVSVVENGTLTMKAVRVVVTGLRPRDLMLAQEVRYAGYDGRIGTLDANFTDNFMPLISDDWNEFFTWKGFGQMPPGELAKLREYVEKAHIAGRRVRFWGTPDLPTRYRTNLWTMFAREGVDYINTDDLAGFEWFALKNSGAV